MRDTWGPPAEGWPSFDKDGRRKPEQDDATVKVVDEPGPCADDA